MAERVLSRKPIPKEPQSAGLSVYRAFLSGGSEHFLLAKRDWILLAGWSGVLAGGVQLLGRPEGGEFWAIPNLVGLALWALLLAAGACTTAGLAARWLGRKLGRWAGLIDAYLMVNLLIWPGVGLPEAIGALLGRWVLGSFALANLIGPMPPRESGWLKGVFWLCLAGCWLTGGWLVGLVSVGICLLSHAWSEDARGLRFFLYPLGWVAGGTILIGGAILQAFSPPQWAFWIGDSSLEGSLFHLWSEFPHSLLLWSGVGLSLACGIGGILGLYFSVLYGGIVSPGGRFFAAWALTAGVAAGAVSLLGGISLPITESPGYGKTLGILLGMLVPAWALATSVGCRQALVVLRRTWGFQKNLLGCPLRSHQES